MLFCSKRVRRKFTDVLFWWIILGFKVFIIYESSVCNAWISSICFAISLFVSSKTLHSSFASCSSCSLLLIFERTLVSCSWSGSYQFINKSITKHIQWPYLLLLNAWFKYGSGLNSRLIELMSSEISFFYCTVAYNIYSFSQQPKCGSIKSWANNIPPSNLFLIIIAEENKSLLSISIGYVVLSGLYKILVVEIR